MRISDWSSDVCSSGLTGAARAGVAHRPEIIRCRYADDAAFGKPRDLAPKVKGVVIGMIDGDRQPGGIDAPAACDQIPGEADRPLLEIVAEREIAEHLEEGVMARGIADIVEIIVLAAGADAFLRRRGGAVGALFQPGEEVLDGRSQERRV